MFKRIRGERGFTLVELLVVLAILAILIAVVVPNLAGQTGGTRAKAASEELHIVQSAFDVLMAEVPAVTISEYSTGGGISVGPSTVITCYEYDGTTITIPTGDFYLRLRGNSTGKYTWDSEGSVSQVSFQQD